MGRTAHGWLERSQMPKDTKVWCEGTVEWTTLECALKPVKPKLSASLSSDSRPKHDALVDETFTLKGEGHGGRSHRPTAELHNSKKRLFNVLA